MSTATRTAPLVLATVLTLAALARPAAADEATAALRGDVEVDPTAYVLDGYSVHAGLTHGRYRLDLGAFAMALPDAVTGQDGFDASFDGFGAKLQVFVRTPQRGPFVGLGLDVSHLLVRREGTELAARHTQVGAGVNFGWRFTFGEHLYASLWLGLGRTFNPKDVTLGGETFSMSPWTVFPAVHLGWRY